MSKKLRKKKKNFSADKEFFSTMKENVNMHVPVTS